MADEEGDDDMFDDEYRREQAKRKSKCDDDVPTVFKMVK